MTEPSPFASFAWLAGTWRGTLEDDRVEEIWGEPFGDSLSGTFRWLKGDRLFLYEIFCLEREDDDTWLRVLHLAPGLVPPAAETEGPPRWRLVAHEEGRAVFEDPAMTFPRRIVYERPDADTLVARLEGAEERAEQRLEFVFRRHARRAEVSP